MAGREVCYKGNRTVDKQREEPKKSKLSLLLVLLLILLLLTSCTAGYVLGRIGNVNWYSGRIIDVIHLSPDRGIPVDPEFYASSVHTGEVWQQNSFVGIFTSNPEANVFRIKGETVIAPGAKGKYVFRLFNPENTQSVYYTLILKESDINNPKLPMKYRLMSNNTGKYVGSDEWVNASQIVIEKALLSAVSSEVLVLEWKWADDGDTKDTEIGTQEGSTLYILEIIVTAAYEKWSN